MIVLSTNLLQSCRALDAVALEHLLSFARIVKVKVPAQTIYCLQLCLDLFVGILHPILSFSVKFSAATQVTLS
jgi:hypothetical protein